MRKIIILLVNFLLFTSVWAQSPQKISYQAVIRDTNSKLIINQPIGLRISILKGSITGIEVYAETLTPNTNSNGLVSIEFGGQTGFDTINWQNGVYFIKTETDPTGGTNYTITGTSQLLSVPYALYAKTAGNGFSGNYNDLTNKPTTNGSETKISAGTNVSVTGIGTTESPYVINSTGSNNSSSHYIGELFQGGIIVSVWKKDGIEHGLIASPTDISSGISWSNITTTAVGATAQSSNNGEANSNAIITQAGHTASAAKLCDDFTSDGFADWYLPSFWELSQCFTSAYIVNNVLGETNGFKSEWYWSSTESGSSYAHGIHFTTGGDDTPNKANVQKVRAVRRF